MERVELHTANLVLRNLRDSDLEVLASYRTDPDTARHIQDPMSRAEVAAHIARRAPGWSRREGETLSLAAEVRADGTVLGEVVIRYLSEHQRQAEVGLALAPAHHRRGHGTEAFLGLLRYCFTEVGLYRLVGYTDVDNDAAVRWSQALGFRCEGRLRGNFFRYGQWRDEFLVAMVADEWPAVEHRYAHLLTPARL
ncbi:MAG TPA: GNAT family protein [Micromonospora sp.]